ncbi:MAG: sigma-70 family RNA polymerase sigma factor [Anaerolineaceae bacterium]|nr:sigma-70 family RNA polymerase sigma factor [Anaerolineaceae bacterium]
MLIIDELLPEQQTEQSKFQDRVWKALGKLPPRQQAAVVQRYFLNCSETEIARWIDAPLGTVKWLLSKARQALRSLLKSERKIL